MSEHIIHIKIDDTDQINKCIFLIRKYSNQPIATIKENILNGYVVSFDWEQPYNFINDIEDIDVHKNFRNLIKNLISFGANLSFWETYNGTLKPITLEIIDNMIASNKAIKKQLEWEDEQALTED